ncbi:MAG: recombinase family protein [Alphaproteobacteria bacterium]|nr:MAG: recombinase family protein [Alphaproteobacteria bacterium]
MTIFGYVRPGSVGCDPRAARARILKAGCPERNIAEEQPVQPGERLTVLAATLGKCRPGDTLVVESLVQLGRSFDELDQAIRALAAGRLSLTVLDQPIFSEFTITALSSLVGALRDFSRLASEERRLMGIRSAKTAGRYRGSVPKVDRDAVSALAKQGLGPTEIARRLNVSRTTVYRLRNE